MAIGRQLTSSGAESGPETFSCSLIHRHNIVKEDIFTVTMEADTSIKGVANHYNDVDMIGRHYLVHHKNFSNKRR